MSARWAAIALVVVAAAGLATRVAAAPVDEEAVRRIAAQLRCVVCQNLSVGDSPSETANQMRAIIRERLAQGETPEQVRAYFVDKYGQWILLEPPRRGFNLLVWLAPFGVFLGGLVVVTLVMLRWRRAARKARTAEPAPVVDEAMRARIRREMADLDAPR